MAGCDRAQRGPAAATPADEPSPTFRNVATPTPYVGDSACAACHAEETSAYRAHAMSRSFHRWSADARVEPPLAAPIRQTQTGYEYAVVEEGGRLWQVETLTGAGGKRLHEQRRRIDHVMGSGTVARTYFTEENGRLFQLPLTWYRDHGWDFSPGYEINNGRFDRLLPDRCVACHASYPRAAAHLEGKYPELRPGIGCERCHGPGALHVAERSARTPRAGAFDATIVNPARLPLERRLDVCEQCHVHTPVSVPREGKGAFDYVPSQPLRDTWAFFKVAGSIDVVSHADRLRQSACFVASRGTPRPLECATCHAPHRPPPDSLARDAPCATCHAPAALAQRLASSPSRAAHAPGADCVTCHMPRVKERTVPHGTFTEHWIRVAGRDSVARASTRRVTRSEARRLERAMARGDDGLPIEPYYARDRDGPEAAVYRGMAGVVYASRAADPSALSAAAQALDRALAERARAGDSTRRDALFLLGVAHEQLGRADGATRTLERALRADADRPEALRALAVAYDRAGRAPDSVGRLYERALALQPALAWVRAEYAGHLQGRGRRDEAIAAYRAALAEQPGLATAWFGLGTALAEAGRGAESAEAFRASVRLDPSLGEAVARLVEVRGAGGVRALESPLPALPARERGPGAARMTVAEGGAPALLFVDVPPRGVVQIARPDGTLLRALLTGEATSVAWDLRTGAGAPVGGGLYQARVHGADRSGRSRVQVLPFGVVRRVGSDRDRP